MRKLAYLKAPFRTVNGDTIYKIVMYTDDDGVYVFMYDSPDAVMSSSDRWYLEEVLAVDDWQEQIDDNGWQEIDDPLPYCQHDALLPIRIKGRDKGEPQWDCFEIFENGEWKEYIP